MDIAGLRRLVEQDGDFGKRGGLAAGLGTTQADEWHFTGIASLMMG